MAKVVKLAVKCPQCGIRQALSVEESDVGTKKKCICKKCNHKFLVSIPASVKSKFESDPTCVGDSDEAHTLIVEVEENQYTAAQSFELASDHYTIGRKNTSGPASRPDVEVVTTDMKISRIHAAIKKKGNAGYTLTDLQSKNGVLHNGEKLGDGDEVYLTDGDTFQLGDTLFRVHLALPQQ